MRISRITTAPNVKFQSKNVQQNVQSKNTVQQPTIESSEKKKKIISGLTSAGAILLLIGEIYGEHDEYIKEKAQRKALNELKNNDYIKKLDKSFDKDIKTLDEYLKLLTQKLKESPINESTTKKSTDIPAKTNASSKNKNNP